jgi:hypothetical protein
MLGKDTPQSYVYIEKSSVISKANGLPKSLGQKEQPNPVVPLQSNVSPRAATFHGRLKLPRWPVQRFAGKLTGTRRVFRRSRPEVHGEIPGIDAGKIPQATGQPEFLDSYQSG